MAELKEGAKAPAFKGVDQNGQPISLATLKQHVAVNTEWWHSLMPEPYAVVPAQ